MGINDASVYQSAFAAATNIPQVPVVGVYFLADVQFICGCAQLGSMYLLIPRAELMDEPVYETSCSHSRESVSQQGRH